MVSPERQSARMSKITNNGLTRSGIGCFIAVPIWQHAGATGLYCVLYSGSASVYCPTLNSLWVRIIFDQFTSQAPTSERTSSMRVSTTWYRHASSLITNTELLGLVHVRRRTAALHQPCCSAWMLSLPATMFVFWASTSTSWRSTLPASTDYVNSAASESHWTMNPRQPLCTPSWRHVLITVTLFMRCHCRRSATGCKGDERDRSSCQWLSCQIWSWTEDNISRRARLTECPWEDWVQAWCDGVWCLHDRAPRYFSDHLIPASDAANHHSLHLRLGLGLGFPG